MLQPIEPDEYYVYQYRIIFRPNQLNGIGQWINCTYEQFLMYKNLVGVLRRDGHFDVYSYTYEVRSMRVHEVFGLGKEASSGV